MSRLFPELDGADEAPVAPRSRAARAPIPAPAPSVPVPAAPRAPMHPQASQGREILTRALAIPSRPGLEPARVTRFDELPDARVVVEITGGGWPDLALFVMPRDGRPGVVDGDHLTFAVRSAGSERATDPVIERIVRHCAMRLRRSTWDSVRSLARPHAGPGPGASAADLADGPTMPGMSWPPTDVDVEYLNSLGFGYRPVGAWRNFLVGHENNYGGIENARGYCQRVTGRVAGVSHTEIECRMSSPTSGDGSITFWNHAQPDWSASRAERDEWIELFSDLTEIDVIKGGHTKLDAMLATLAERPNAPEVVVLTSTCTTTVIGDDTVGAVEKLRAKKPLRVVNMAETRDVPMTLFEQARSKPSFTRVARLPRSVNLLGLPRFFGQIQLLEMLRDAGVTVNAWILPDMHPSDVDRFMAAELTVLYDWQSLDRAYEGMLAGLDMKTVRPPVPFGVEGTRAWLLQIGEALGDPATFASVWEKHHERARPTWEALSRRARGYRLGFVGEERLLGRYLDSRQLFGIDILELLEEMGFGIDLHLVPASGEVPDHQPRVSSDGTRRTIWVETADELERSLSEGDAVAYYSEIFFDRRLTRTGRNLFSVREFGRLGLEGGIDGLRRMLRACEMSFFRNYGKYFGSAFGAGYGE